jgi:LysR family glycine cleavage system transcriptional activator
MRRRLPPLAALRAFEAAGRLLSFSKAGEELLVGQSAISHHIRVLEQYLGVSLFVRQVRAVRLTQEGSRYLAKVTDAFDLLADATTDVSPPAHGVVRVRLLASFAVHWLMPRLGRFRALHPNTEVVLDASIDLTDLDSGEVDLAIRYGGGNWPGLEIRNLMSEAISPVMSPALITQGPILNDPSDLMGHDILVSSSHRGGDWDAWSHAAGIDPNCCGKIVYTITPLCFRRRSMVRAWLWVGTVSSPINSPRDCSFSASHSRSRRESAGGSRCRSAKRAMSRKHS